MLFNNGLGDHFTCLYIHVQDLLTVSKKILYEILADDTYIQCRI